MGKRKTELASRICEDKCKSDQMFTCDICNRQFAYKGNLTRHTNEVHFKSTFFKCQRCEFNRRSYLTRHLKFVHKLNSHDANSEAVFGMMEVDNNQNEASYYEDVSSDEVSDDRRIVQKINRRKVTNDVSSNESDSSSDSSVSSSDYSVSEGEANCVKSNDNSAVFDEDESDSEDENEMIKEEIKKISDSVEEKGENEGIDKNEKYKDEAESENEEMEFEIRADELDELYNKFYQRDISDGDGTEEENVGNDDSMIEVKDYEVIRDSMKFNEDDLYENEMEDIVIAETE